MATIDLTKDTFRDTVTKEGIVLIDWWAEWCGPCRAFKPIFEAASEQHQDVTFAKINTDEQQELAGAFEIRSIPMVMLFRDGVLLFAQPGSLPQPALEELIGKARELDMVSVQKQIAEAKATAAGAPAAKPN
ncbi:MAG TPA: thioredoxin [Myxococcaceae bacterium]|jgi:thioredoxin 1